MIFAKRERTMLLVTTAMGMALASAAQAQEREGDATVLQDIVVTARRTEERLQDVPISITVFDQEQLSNLNVSNAKDLATYTPSLTANSRFGSDNTTFTIRGFSQEQRTTATVAVYFADVVAPRSSGIAPGGEGAGPGNLFDLQNVQVLKGPQGTLFGRNTTGGAILLVPRKPTDRNEGYLEGSYGNYDMRRLQGVWNVPVSDAVRFRAGFDWQKRDGYLKNISGVGPGRLGAVDYIAGRASLVVDLTPDLENYTIVSAATSQNSGVIPGVKVCFPGLAFSSFACPQLARLRSAGGFWTVENSQGDAKVSNRTWQAINTTTWSASDALTVKNIASYAEYRGDQRIDAFGTFWPIAGSFFTFVPVRTIPGGHVNAQSTFTEELQFQGRAMANRLVWQAGGYVEISDPLGKAGTQTANLLLCSDQDAFLCTDILGRPPGTVGSINRGWTKTKYRDYALYAQGSYDLTDQLKLTAGIRYTWDRARAEARKWTIRYPAPNAPAVYCTDASSGPIGPTVVSGALDFSNAIPLAQLETSCGRKDRKNSDAPTWLLDLDYKPVEDVLVYAKWARGYRQGSTAPLSADGYNTYNPEKVNNYEVGAKTSWRGAMPGSFNAALFYNDFRDQQINVGFRNAANTASPTIGIQNVGKSKIWGAELEARLSPVQGLWLEAAYAYLETELSKVTPIALNPDSIYNMVDLPREGQRLPFAPKNKVAVSAQYRLPLSEDIGEISLGATFTHQSSVVTGTTEFAIVPGYETLNVNANWNDVFGRPVDLSVFATNVTNEKYFTHVNDQGSRGFISYFLGEPRMYGVRVRYKFGG